MNNGEERSRKVPFCVFLFPSPLIYCPRHVVMLGSWGEWRISATLEKKVGNNIGCRVMGRVAAVRIGGRRSECIECVSTY